MKRCLLLIMLLSLGVAQVNNVYSMQKPFVPSVVKIFLKAGLTGGLALVTGGCLILSLLGDGYSQRDMDIEERELHHEVLTANDLEYLQSKREGREGLVRTTKIFGALTCVSGLFLLKDVCIRAKPLVCQIGPKLLAPIRWAGSKLWRL